MADKYIFQSKELVDLSIGEALGKTEVLNEDLTNMVDVGDTIINHNKTDVFVKALTTGIIGKTVAAIRTYKGGAVPDVLRDSNEWGIVLQKITYEMPKAEENLTWELVDKKSYDTNVFRQPKVTVKYFSDFITFEIPYSITDKQLRDAFANPVAMDVFVSGLYIVVQNAMRVALDKMILSTVTNAIAETLYDAFPEADYSANSTARAVNLRKLYNATLAEDAQLTPEQCWEDKDFLRYASKTMSRYKKKMQNMSVLFNIEGKERFTPEEDLHFVVLADFASNIKYNLESDTWHNEIVSLPRYEEVAYWQGSGLDFSYNECSEIDVKTASGHDVSAAGIVGVLFDHDMLGVFNESMNTTTHYVASAEFTNFWAKHRARYFNDFSENMVVFFIA